MYEGLLGAPVDGDIRAAAAHEVGHSEDVDEDVVHVRVARHARHGCDLEDKSIIKEGT